MPNDQQTKTTTSKRVAILYEGGSLNVHTTADIEEAKRMLCYEPNEDQRLVEVEIIITKILDEKPKLNIITQDVIVCPCCGEHIYGDEDAA